MCAVPVGAKISRLLIFLGCRIPVYSTLNIGFFRDVLADYGDTNLVEFLEFGWPVSHDRSQPTVVIPRNHKGAREFPDAISAYLKKEKHYGAILGPFDESPFLSAPLALSPLNSVPKSDGSRRIILDLSFPEGAGAVNDGIYKKQFLGQPISLHYPQLWMI